jgi:glycerol-3-phosphate dehydrogenase
MTDVIIIGAGVVGCAVARELSKYNAKVVVIERRNDVACGASKANSGIVHAGFDATPGTKKAYYNVLGAKMYAELYEELDIPYRRNGAFVLNFSEEGNAQLQKLYDQGIANGVEGNKIISGDEVRAMEPSVSKEVVSALYVPSSAIVGPYEATLAFAENAYVNGVEFVFDTKVISVEKQEYFTIKTDNSVGTVVLIGVGKNIQAIITVAKNVVCTSANNDARLLVGKLHYNSALNTPQKVGG